MASSTPSSSTKHIAAQEDRVLSILYATETGTAQDVADRLARLCRGLRIRARVHRTTRDDPLWNMLLRADLPEDLFEDLAFATFGLGDSAYEKFCWPAKLLSRRLAKLGASELCSRGEGDDQHHLGVDGALGPWMEALSNVLKQIYPLPNGVAQEPLDSLPPARVTMSDAPMGAQRTRKDPLVADREYHLAIVKCNKRITAEDWYQDVRHFEFSFDDEIRYNPGDVAVIHPETIPADVESFLACIGYANFADDPIDVRHALEDQSLPDHLPSTTTLREIFTRYLDINAVPRRSFFAVLKHFAQDELEREKLEEFLSEEGADEMYEYCQRPRRTIREVLEEFRSAKIPREYVFDLFPPLRPRQFSIASSVKTHPKSIHLCIAIVQYRTMLKIPRRGVCTSWLSRLKAGDQLLIGVQKGFITLPTEPTIPVICIGPGTGVAPMRAVIQERIHDGIHANTLYFGCRSASKDHHYGEEWEEYVSSDRLTYRAAFSRDGPEGAPRTYVQDLIRDDAKRMDELVREMGAWVYISGSSNKMPAAVRAAIRHALVSEGGMSEDEAQEFVVKMEKDGRLIEECWS
ncbi:riboflavin synthase domain-like protein [Lenzites betulinus]|nr:riboflavin synthase domain-like protein [Lenzites betulinus]